MRAWVPLSSSHIAAVRHDAASSELHVKFTDGSSYAYSGVPFGVYQGLMDAESAGAFLRENVKGVFPHKPLEDDDG